MNSRIEFLVSETVTILETARAFDSPYSPTTPFYGKGGETFFALRRTGWIILFIKLNFSKRYNEKHHQVKANSAE
jgi:hypothetical protein